MIYHSAKSARQKKIPHIAEFRTKMTTMVDFQDVPFEIGQMNEDSLLLPFFHEIHERKGVFNTRKWKN